MGNDVCQHSVTVFSQLCGIGVLGGGGKPGAIGNDVSIFRRYEPLAGVNVGYQPVMAYTNPVNLHRI